VRRSAGTLVGNGPVPLETKTIECGKDFITCSGLFAGWIDVLYTEQPLAAVVAGFQEARNGRQQ
jgi:hypothetical protein